MIRHCDGKDPTLIMAPPHSENPRSCDCGARFDDANHLAYFPHTEFGPSVRARALADFVATADFALWKLEFDR